MSPKNVERSWANGMREEWRQSASHGALRISISDFLPDALDGGWALDQPPVRRDGLQIKEARPFQERFWKAERLAWIGFGLVLLLALLGVTGSGGPFSRMNIAFDGGFVEVPRFSRWQTSDSLTALLPPGEADRRLIVDSAFFRTFQIEDIVPPPFASENTSNGTVYHFRSEPEIPLPLTLHLRAQGPGMARYRVGVNDEALRPARTIVWP